MGYALVHSGRKDWKNQTVEDLECQLKTFSLLPLAAGSQYAF
jgi:hypothetical protein